MSKRDECGSPQTQCRRLLLYALLPAVRSRNQSCREGKHSFALTTRWASGPVRLLCQKSASVLTFAGRLHLECRH